MSIDREVDVKQLMVSSNAIAMLIDREIERGVESKRIIVAGFSQGGAVAYQCALTYAKPLAGLLALSTYFATQKIIQPTAENSKVPVFIGHGTADPVVPELLGRMANTKLIELGYAVDYKTYAMEHSVCMEEITDIGKWIQAVFST
ncbi:MAG: dienelactone hydrolase family protein, partial [Thiotrichaceae bacterium]